MRDQQNLELGSCECRNDGFYMPWEGTSNDCYFKPYIAGGYYQRYILVLPWDVL
jgi:hypothetical protein